jgi:hypothetical protein
MFLAIRISVQVGYAPKWTIWNLKNRSVSSLTLKYRFGQKKSASWKTTVCQTT